MREPEPYQSETVSPPVGDRGDGDRWTPDRPNLVEYIVVDRNKNHHRCGSREEAETFRRVRLQHGDEARIYRREWFLVSDDIQETDA